MTKFPLLDDFYDDEPFLTPDKCVNPLIRQIYLDKVVSRNVTTAVLLWLSNPLAVQSIVGECEPLADDVAWQTFLWKEKVVIVMLRIGAPTAAACIEELRIFGIKNFIAEGAAGCIVKGFDDSNIVVIDRAIRDEGTSFHYLEPSVYVDLDKDLASQISKFLSDKGIKSIQGTTWTTDAFYRETKNRIAKRIEQGALSVEMECSALAAATKFYGLRFGQFVWFSDKVDNGDWSWLVTGETRWSIKEKMLSLALEFAKTLR